MIIISCEKCVHSQVCSKKIKFANAAVSVENLQHEYEDIVEINVRRNFFTLLAPTVRTHDNYVGEAPVERGCPFD